MMTPVSSSEQVFFSLRHERNINKRCMNYMYEDDMCGPTGDV